MIPYARQDVNAADVEAVVEVLRSDFLTQGPVGPRFERAVAARCGAAHGVAANSATSALHLACRALGLGPGDRLWTSAMTFVASANCGRFCGAEVDFVDIDPRTYNLDAQALARKLEQAQRENRLPKIVVPVHFAGQPCDMAAIGELAKRYGFRVIADASHALGATYRGAPVGRGRYGDITVFSFHPVKLITTGEGGLALTNDAALAAHMRLLRSHGITREAESLTQAPHGPWHYEQVELGHNYRMTELQAALGLSQLQRLDAFLARRRALAQRYDEKLADLPLTRPWQHPDGESAWHLYVIRVAAQRHRTVFESLRERGVGVALHYMPVPAQPYYRALGAKPEDFPQAMKYYGEAISLPLYPGLDEAQQDEVVAALRQALA